MTRPSNETAATAALSSAFERVNHWIFDLDNTLYPADCHLFHQIDSRMSQFIQTTLDMPPDEARRLQKAYYVQYGTTLSGLMIEHAIKPGDFLDFVHDIDVSGVPENDALARHISALPGPKYIFTNGSVAHAENVIGKIGLSGLFTDIFDIAAADYTPKPHDDAYHRFLRRTNVKPTEAAMFEDLAHNLTAPHELGMTTVLVCSDAQWMDDEPAEKRPARIGEDGGFDDVDHVHHVTHDITDFLGDVVTATNANR